MYSEFIDDGHNAHSCNVIGHAMRTFNNLFETNTVPDDSECIEIANNLTDQLKNDQRIERFEINNGMLEIYTQDITFNADDLGLGYRNIAYEHKTLNFGKFCVLIKPGFAPIAFPFDLTNFNVPKLYLHEAGDLVTEDSINHGFTHIASVSGMQQMTCTHWYTTKIGKLLGVYHDEARRWYKVPYPHPHVHTSGSICYGNSMGMLEDAVMSGSMGFVVSLTLDVLFNYTDDSPYFKLWTCDVCTGCDRRGTYKCQACACSECGEFRSSSAECTVCEKRGTSDLGRLLGIALGVVEVNAMDMQTDRYYRISELENIIDKYMETYVDRFSDSIENRGRVFVDGNNHAYALRNRQIEDILGVDMDDLEQ